MSSNLFASGDMPADGGEFFETLLAQPGVRIERIVSTGQASPPGFWFEQADAEWVALLQGEALLRFEDEDAPRRLTPGDWVTIAARRRHRVEWTPTGTTTIWLAVHLASA